MTPESFILTTDYATLKNDSEPLEVTVTIPASVVIPATSTVSYSSTITAGTPGAPATYSISHSYTGIVHPGYVYQFITDGVVTGFPASYSYNVFIYRSAGNQITIGVSIYNQYPDPLTTEANVRTATGYIRTFIPPNA